MKRKHERLRVLAVEDSDNDASLLRAELERAGFAPELERVDTAPALRGAISRQTWDVVVSDFSMPHFTALAALEVLRNSRIEVPVFVLSGTITEEAAAAAVRAGASACLTKDRLLELGPLIERELGERRIRGRRRSSRGNAGSFSAPDFRALFESAPGLYLVLTPDLKVAAVSDAYLRATMTRREEILGRDLFEIFPDNPDDASATGARNLRASLEWVLSKGEANTMAVQKYDIRRPDAEGGGFEERFWSPMNSPVLGLQGEVTYIIHRVEDVTEFIRLKNRGAEQSKLTEVLRERTHQMESEIFLRAQEVQESNRRLQAANDELERVYEKTKELERLKTEFFANVSHELRTPLALILGPTEKLLASASWSESERRDLEVIARNARALLKHVNDLLDLSKMEFGGLKPLYTDCDLAALMRLAAGHFETLAQDRGIACAIEGPSTLRAQIDREKLQGVLLNLLSNAIKFTPAGGRIRCSLRQDPARSRAVLEIADSGPGIRAEEREAAFERFRQLQGGADRRFGGTGLGLAIARDFVELHGGAISLGDAPEGGALVTVELPVRAPEGVDVRPAPAEESISGESARPFLEALAPAPKDTTTPAPREANRPSVLVVEDNREMNQFIRESLSGEYQVETAFDGAEGLRKAMASPPDLVVTDMMMPGMTGEALLRAIRDRRDFDRTPVVVLTAKADDDLRVNLLRAGAQDYMLKPFSAEELRARIGNLVSSKRAEDRVRQTNERLSRLTSELSAVNRELEAFSYSVSHDLRAPVRHINGFVGMLRRKTEGVLGEEASRYLERISEAATRMGELIDGLLLLSRTSRTDLRRETVHMGELLSEVLREMAPDTQARNIAWHVGTLPGVFGDRRLLKQVWTNLLSNAVKYTRLREQANIEIGFRKTEEEVEFFVRDDGAGFDMNHAGKLFGVFQRLHGTEFEGTGIGLANVQRIVTRHGGRAWAEGETGRGATFYFTLPDTPPARH